MKYVVITISVVLMIAGIGCMTVSEFVTPADKEEKIVEYVVNNGGGHVKDYEIWPYFNLNTALKLDKDFDITHDGVQLKLRQAIEWDNSEYANLKEISSNNLSVAREREQLLFGKEGLLSTGLALLGMGGLSGFAGLLIKRPSDITKKEYESALAQATGKTQKELSTKQKQIVELVMGVNQLIDTFNLPKDKYAPILNGTQDTDTQIEVSKVKKEYNL